MQFFKIFFISIKNIFQKKSISEMNGDNWKDSGKKTYSIQKIFPPIILSQ